MKWSREEYLDLMTYNHPSKEMFVQLFGMLIGLREEWMAQGATTAQLDLSAFAFDWMDVFRIQGTGTIHNMPEITLEETDEYIIRRDYLGRTTKLCKGSSTLLLPLDFPVKDMESWLHIRHMYEDAPERTTPALINGALEAQRRGAMVVVSIPGGFDVLRELMGEETTCLAYYDQPELVEDILDTVSRTNQRVIGEYLRHVRIDQLSVHEDMAGKHAPLVGPEIVRKHMVPYYRKTWDMLKDSGTKLFCQDSDGNMGPVIDAFIEGGVNVFYPCEPAAGMDVVALRKQYGKTIAFKGGIDKHVLRASKDDIYKELEYKLQPCMRGGGIAFGIDHLIPNGTPLENFVFFVDTAREMLGMPPTKTAEPGWARMAF